MTATRNRIDLRGVRILTFDECDDCGALVGNVDKHANNCPRIMPPKPEPITPDRYVWAQIINEHRGRTVGYKPGETLSCACGKFVGVPFAHAQHVAAMIANHVEANR